MESMSLIFRQLASMLNAGIGVRESLDILGDENEDKGAKQLALDVRRDLTLREAPTKANESYPLWFQSFIRFILTKDTVVNDLPEMMYCVADDHESLEDLESRFFSAMIYPATTITIAAVVTGVILVFVIPTLSEMFNSFGSVLPKPTLLVITISNWFIRVSYWLILAVLGFFMAIKYNKWVRDRFLLLIPGLNQIIKILSLIRFSRYLAMMLSLDAPIRLALDVAVDAVPNTVHAIKLKDAVKHVEDPKTICDALERTGYYSKMAIRLLVAGEKSGSLSQALKGLAQYYEKSKMRSIEQSVQIFEIVSTMIVASLIGFLVISMYLPIFKMAGVVGG